MACVRSYTSGQWGDRLEMGSLFRQKLWLPLIRGLRPFPGGHLANPSQNCICLSSLPCARPGTVPEPWVQGLEGPGLDVCSTAGAAYRLL